MLTVKLIITNCIYLVNFVWYKEALIGHPVGLKLCAQKIVDTN